LALADDFNRLERSLPDDWAEVRLAVTVRDESRAHRAAALLAPAMPGRRGSTFRLAVTRRGGGLGPEAMRRLLRRLDQEGIPARIRPLAIYEAP
jgi:hypothetical protein